jgi:DNA-binding winged helix-turn-helix (wHTH) protein
MGVSYPDRSSIVRFGPFELDLQIGALLKDGVRVRCQEQPLQVLAALAERPGELVTREELRRRVWPQDTFVDFDHALNTAIKKIRASLNDDADSPRYIETVPRRGYRLMVLVGQGSKSSLGLALPSEAKHRGFAMAGVLIVILAIIGFTWRLAPWHGDGSTSPQFQRLTFDLPELGNARFTPDGASVVYSAGSFPHKTNIYAQRVGAPGPQQLGITSSRLLAVSPQAELAVLEEDPDSQHSMEMSGTLARVPLSGGAPRELLPKSGAADWSPSGELAVVRQMGSWSRLEFPVGRVLYESTGQIATPRFSPTGDLIAFLDHRRRRFEWQ